jgi:hypothetical protein
MHSARILSLVVCLGVLPVHAQDQASDQIARVPAGTLVELAVGRVVRLAGIRMPAEAGSGLFEQARSYRQAGIELVQLAVREVDERRYVLDAGGP